MMNITPRNSPKAELPPRRAKRRQDGEEKKTHKSSQKDNAGMVISIRC